MPATPKTTSMPTNAHANSIKPLITRTQVNAKLVIKTVVKTPIKAPPSKPPAAQQPQTPSDPDRPIVPSACNIRPGTNLAMVAALPSCQKGASTDDMMKSSGWQAHSVRSALTSLRKRGLAIKRTINNEGCSQYCIADLPPAPIASAGAGGALIAPAATSGRKA